MRSIEAKWERITQRQLWHTSSYCAHSSTVEGGKGRNPKKERKWMYRKTRKRERTCKFGN